MSIIKECEQELLEEKKENIKASILRGLERRVKCIESIENEKTRLAEIEEYLKDLERKYNKLSKGE